MFLLIRFSIWHSFKFKIDFPSTKYKICHVSVTTPLDIALSEIQFATSCGVAARSSLKKFKFKMDFPCAKYKFVIFLLPHQQIWHSEKISLQHRVVWQQDHLLEDVWFQIDLHLQKKKILFLLTYFSTWHSCKITCCSSKRCSYKTESIKWTHLQQGSN